MCSLQATWPQILLFSGGKPYRGSNDIEHYMSNFYPKHLPALILYIWVRISLANFCTCVYLMSVGAKGKSCPVAQ